jgi:hypothetical protein
LAQRNKKIGMTFSARALLALTLVAWPLGCAPTYASECRDETEPFAGTLRLVRTRHAMNSSPVEALQLVFKPRLCILYKESVNQKDRQRLDAVRTMHLLVTASETAQLKRRLGARVTAKAGKDGGVSPALTAWHIGDAVMVHPQIFPAGR